VALPRPELRTPEHQDGIQDRLAEEAGIQEISRKQKLSRRKVTPHILRHSHVVNALMAGVPVPMIQRAGWGTRNCSRRRFMSPWRWRW